MKKLIYISFVLFLFTSCSPSKRIQRIADKHGTRITDTLHLDTLVFIPSFSFDTIVENEIRIEAGNTFVDTTNLILDDGTQIQIIESSQVQRGKNNGIEMINSKKGFIINRPGQSIPIKMDIEYDKIEVKPPDKLDVLLLNFKWAALMALAIALIISTIRKLFQ